MEVSQEVDIFINRAKVLKLVKNYCENKRKDLGMYSYYYIKTDCLSNTWDTTEILDYLRSFTVLDEKDNGIFVSKKPFLDISLMKVKDLNSWSSLDFDKEETNYVSIVTSDFSEENIEVKKLLKGMEQLLGFRICSDNCEREVW